MQCILAIKVSSIEDVRFLSLLFSHFLSESEFMKRMYPRAQFRRRGPISALNREGLRLLMTGLDAGSISAASLVRSSISIFRVISFYASWKFLLWLENSAWAFLIWSRDFFGF